MRDLGKEVVDQRLAVLAIQARQRCIHHHGETPFALADQRTQYSDGENLPLTGRQALHG
ncbi:hypothetical protein D3C84_1042080 [compost metagenome]